MADDTGLLAIDVNVDDYAETAAGDTPSVSRTFQSEEDFLAQRNSYSARVDNGNQYAEFLKAVPVFADSLAVSGERIKLTKKEYQLLGYAAGELYFDHKFAKLLDLCDMVEERCEVDVKLRESLDRWRGRARAKMDRIEETR